MNEWFAKTKDAERYVFQAEEAECRSDIATAISLYTEATKVFARVAKMIPPSHPNTQRDLAEAARTCQAHILRLTKREKIEE